MIAHNRIDARPVKNLKMSQKQICEYQLMETQKRTKNLMDKTTPDGHNDGGACLIKDPHKLRNIKLQKQDIMNFLYKAMLFILIFTFSIFGQHKENEYGITNNHGTSCAVLHLRTETTEKQKVFNTGKEADEFIKKMPLKIESGMALESYCENPRKIKNIKIQ